jgi:hypothetical protein
MYMVAGQGEILLDRVTRRFPLGAGDSLTALAGVTLRIEVGQDV